MATQQGSNWITSLGNAFSNGLGAYTNYKVATRPVVQAPAPTPVSAPVYMPTPPTGQSGNSGFSSLFGAANKPLLYGSIALLGLALAKKNGLI